MAVMLYTGKQGNVLTMRPAETMLLYSTAQHSTAQHSTAEYFHNPNSIDDFPQRFFCREIFVFTAEEPDHRSTGEHAECSQHPLFQKR